jgi:hypothetical protein
MQVSAGIRLSWGTTLEAGQSIDLSGIEHRPKRGSRHSCQEILTATGQLPIPKHSFCPLLETRKHRLLDAKHWPTRNSGRHSQAEIL